jgi:hypothetical protein
MSSHGHRYYKVIFGVHDPWRLPEVKSVSIVVVMTIISKNNFDDETYLIDLHFVAHRHDCDPLS